MVEEDPTVARLRAQEEERKRKVKATIKNLFVQMKTGCEKDICFNKYCWKNPFGNLLTKFNQFRAKKACIP